MQIISLYRITSHKQVVEVDNASSSPDKVSNQIIIFENELPDKLIVKKFIEGTSVGTILVVDAFDKQPFNTFDLISGAEANLKVIKQLEVEVSSAVLCLPADYLTFYLGQVLDHKAKVFNIKVITLSDRAHRGVYSDKSGPKATELITEYFKEIGKTALVKNTIIPDSKEELAAIIEESRQEKTDILITTGGTGINRRDITVETIQKHLDKEIPGIMEMIRVKYGANNPKALLSRAVAGTIKHTLIYTLPGSPKAVEEYLTEIFKTLDHLLYMIHGIDNH
ncbi:MAG: MogA/MoaB family molybdenum cofactor biosynthesis protein [Salinivirgaceae bacterium]|nr:MogA/MoaB family molybdenum cofactor biosynthesis protein [Salinivirgaceae bacterium]